MPDPTGWRLLILPYRGKGKTEGGIYLPNTVVEENAVSTQVGYVLKVGELAYQDSEKFPEGPWCAKGDWVMFARYAGSRFRIDGGEVRILNDDEILATIQSPEDVLHFQEQKMAEVNQIELDFDTEEAETEVREYQEMKT